MDPGIGITAMWILAIMTFVLPSVVLVMDTGIWHRH
jgi:hypothetical protein